MYKASSGDSSTSICSFALILPTAAPVPRNMSRALYHSIVLLNYVAALIYDITYVDLILLPKEAREGWLLKGRLMFLTIWNMVSDN